MAKKTNSTIWRFIIFLVVAVVAWLQYRESGGEGGLIESIQASEQQRGKSGGKKSSKLKKQFSGKYEVLNGCEWIPHKHNDGDSFHVRTPAGKDVEFRLYFVDAPESRPKTYGHGENNFKRIADQGAYFGGLTQQQTVKIGAEAKQFVRSLLSQKKFQVTTSWEPVYNSARRYAFVTVSWQGKPRYLHEILVSKGYARIHTLGRPLPDGKTSYYQQKSHLKQLEQTAKRQRQGAWGIR